ncbi:hypothetical protein KAH94_02330, partial [bacterium]|nr:hypothetical protein [bacterium]
MNKFLIIGVFAAFFFYSDFCQVILINQSGKAINFAFKFFHTEAKQKMSISDFKLNSNKKTSFPQQKDLHLARPIKLKVNWKNNPDSMVTENFDRDDTNVYEVKALKNDKGQLELKKIIV